MRDPYFPSKLLTYGEHVTTNTRNLNGANAGQFQIIEIYFKYKLLIYTSVTITFRKRSKGIILPIIKTARHSLVI